MNNQYPIIRHDDFDFRLSATDYINIHEQFRKVGLIETMNTQFTQDGRLSPVPEELIAYVRSVGDYDVQIHGWAHHHYDEMHTDFIIRDLACSIYFCQKYFGKTPTVWYPPWNCMSLDMERAAAFVGLRIDNESNDIAKFIREVEVEKARNGKWLGHSVYFHLWKHDEAVQIPRMLELAKWLNERGI